MHSLTCEIFIMLSDPQWGTEQTQSPLMVMKQIHNDSHWWKLLFHWIKLFQDRPSSGLLEKCFEHLWIYPHQKSRVTAESMRGGRKIGRHLGSWRNALSICRFILIQKKACSWRKHERRSYFCKRKKGKKCQHGCSKPFILFIASSLKHHKSEILTPNFMIIKHTM